MSHTAREIDEESGFSALLQTRCIHSSCLLYDTIHEFAVADHVMRITDVQIYISRQIFYEFGVGILLISYRIAASS